MGVATVGWAPSAQAQATDEKVEKVTVTGTRIKQPNNTAATATSSISATDIEISGEPNVVDVLRDLPQTGISALSSVNSNFLTTNNGVNTLDLRNLGENRTLVLVNGRRMIAGVALSSIVDFNSIPVELIERIDIMSGGSSSVYGSDAVAGVVNIILRKNFEGVRANVQWGKTDEYNDADTWVASGLMGANFADGKGNATFGLGFNSAGPAYARSRPDTAQDCLSNAFFGGPFLTQSCPFFSSFAEGGRYNFSNPTGVQFAPNVPVLNRALAANQTISPFSTALQGFNRQAKRLHSVPFDKRSAFGTLNYEFSPAVAVFGEFIWSNTISKSDIEPFPLDSADIYGETVQLGSINDRRSGVSPDNPFVPRAMLDLLCVNWSIAANLAACQALARPGLVASLMATPDAAVGFQRRMTELGNRGQEFDSATARMVVGLTGKIADWDYELSYNYGVTKANQIGGGQVNQANFFEALNVIDTNADGNAAVVTPADVICASHVARLAGCVPVNIFTTTTVPGTWTQEQINWLKADTHRQQQQTQEIVAFNATGDIIENWAGVIAGAVGAEYRLETGSDTPDALSQSGGNGGNVSPVTGGGYDVWEAFAEIEVPLISDVPLIKSLEVHGAGRVSQYSSAGRTLAWSGDLAWVVTDGVRLRGQMARSVRAPNIGELFTGSSETFGVVTDPCNNIQIALADAAAPPYTNLNTAGTTSDTVIENCLLNPGIFARATGAAPGFVLSQPELQGTGGFNVGNPGLDPEQSDSLQYGIVFTPDFWGDWLGSLTMSVDYFQFEVTNAIGGLSRNNTLTTCYNSTPPLSSPFCDQTVGGPVGWVRDVNGALVEVNTQVKNQNEFETSGWDFQLNYAFDVNSLLSLGTDLGRLNMNAQWTHLNSYTFTALAGSPQATTTTSVGAIGAAEDQGIFSAIWNVGDLRLTWSGQYISEANDFAPEIIPSQWFHDMSARYQLTDNLAIYGGVRNIADNYVFIGQSVGGQVPTGWTTAPDTYDGLGRRYYIGARVEF